MNPFINRRRGGVGGATHRLQESVALALRVSERRVLASGALAAFTVEPPPAIYK
jgi:hypothetical protein